MYVRSPTAIQAELTCVVVAFAATLSTMTKSIAKAVVEMYGGVNAREINTADYVVIGEDPSDEVRRIDGNQGTDLLMTETGSQCDCGVDEPCRAA